MSNLSDLLPTGGGQNAVDFVASGTLGSGVTVALKADGTVSVVGESGPSVGTSAVFETSNTYSIASTFDSAAGKVVIAYTDSGNTSRGTAIVGTVSGTSITFGTPVVFESGSTSYISATFDSTNNKVVIAYRDAGNSGYGKAIVGTVSGTSITFGTEVVFNSGSTFYTSSTFDTAANKVVITYADSGNGAYGTAIVGTVSGTSISFGTEVVFESANSIAPSTTFDSTAGKVVIAYADAGNSGYGTAIVGTVSGTSISFGSAVVFNSSNSNSSNVAATFDSAAGKVVLFYRDSVNSYYGTAIVGTVSGTSISFGTAVVMISGDTPYLAPTFDSAAGKVVIAYRDTSTLTGKAIVGTVSGTSISFGTAIVFNNADVGFNASTFDSAAGKVIIAYQDIGNSSYGTSIVFSISSTNNTSFIGITAEAIADTATGPVNVFGGVNEAQSGLTIAADYYVQSDGSIATTVSDVKIGQAISATTINIRDLT
tara:strand:- start:539 stop:1987 length:1449 start_codon:yes stop_codon:yes gene_type:complete